MDSIAEYLRQVGCCQRCSLRFAEVKDETRYTTKSNDTNESAEKKLKENPCVACLGILQTEFIAEVVKRVEECREIREYDCATYSIALSLPVALQLRSQSIRHAIEDKFPDYEGVEMSLKEIWKWVYKSMSSNIGKMFEYGADKEFIVSLRLVYNNDNNELEVLDKLPSKVKFNKMQNKPKWNHTNVEKLICDLDRNTFAQLCAIPPSTPDCFVRLDGIQCHHNSIYIGGRYLKYSRELSQTPWILNGKRMMESSVQEIMCEPIFRMFDLTLDDVVFCASGREDVDVRCLGQGRPFFIEILNPKRTKITGEQIQTLEKQINLSDKINVRLLQMVKRSDLKLIKEGEESKKKKYRALCVCDPPLNQSDLAKLECFAKETVIMQKTPIRVLHRRPLAVRQRTVFDFFVEPVADHPELIIANITTQAGTYVKEFVHGDFNRTKPNLRSILEREIDIIALDVTDVLLDWPRKYE